MISRLTSKNHKLFLVLLFLLLLSRHKRNHVSAPLDSDNRSIQVPLGFFLFSRLLRETGRIFRVEEKICSARTPRRHCAIVPLTNRTQSYDKYQVSFRESRPNRKYIDRTKQHKNHKTSKFEKKNELDKDFVTSIKKSSPREKKKTS